jgi:hypothetical protein
MTLESTAAAKLRLVVWCKACGRRSELDTRQSRHAGMGQSYPSSNTVCARMCGQREQSRRGSDERYAFVRAEQRGWALPCRHRRLRSPVADAGRGLPLPTPFKGAILPPSHDGVARICKQSQ